MGMANFIKVEFKSPLKNIVHIASKTFLNGMWQMSTEVVHK